MEQLNKFAKQDVDGLILVATIENGLAVQIQLPTAFDVGFRSNLPL